MSTLNNQLYIDAVVVYGIGRIFSCSLRQPTEETQNSRNVVTEPLDLTNSIVRFRVLGSAEGEGYIILEKVITRESDPNLVGVIDDPTTGDFTFAITPADTYLLGRGSRPISIEILDKETEELIVNLTEGGTNQGEFNKITVVNV